MANTEISRSMRLDVYVVQEYPRLSRAFAVKLIEEGAVRVNGKPEKPGYKVRVSDTIEIDFDEASLDVIPEIELPILYEDNDVIVINKPIGVISHARGRYWDEASVASFVRQRVADIEGDRAGIVHRLDRATSGVMICAKNQAALSMLQKQFSQRNTKKTYTAIVQGEMNPPAALIDMPIERNPKKPSTFRVGPNGKAAQTYYETTRSVNGYTLLELKPETGRTHQLRVHLEKQGHPIVGDVLYGGAEADRLYLHAHKLEITIPHNSERKVFEAPIPVEFEELLAS